MQNREAVRLERAAAHVAGRTVWSDVTLTIGQGEFVAVLGPNGAGKSTLLTALLGVIPLSEGKATVFGQPVQRGSDAIGYLPQRRQFDPDLRIRAADLVRLGLDGDRWGIPLPSHEKAQRVDEILALAGASAYKNRPVGELSGGEQQRILIAQALVSGAKMLALDEPLESLDLHNQQAISELIRGICRSRGVTVLLVAHDVNPILPFVDRVIYVAGGHVLEGRPEEVITGETLSRLYGVPVEVFKTSDGRLVVVGQYEPVTHHPEHH